MFVVELTSQGEFCLPSCPTGLPMASSLSGVTGLLRAWSEGDDRALGKLTSVVYEELYRLARYYMADERPDHILQSTALISEIYVHLIKLQKTDWRDRKHFFGVCSQLMRHILTDYARSQLYLKRGGEAEHLPLHEGFDVPEVEMAAELIAVDDALRDLSKLDQRASEVVQLRFFCGFSLDEISKVLNISERTVRRDWDFAKFWLVRELQNGTSDRQQQLAAAQRLV
jgi:RNA polymerase sigma-70 factor (ECF subfamily)